MRRRDGVFSIISIARWVCIACIYLILTNICQLNRTFLLVYTFYLRVLRTDNFSALCFYFSFYFEWLGFFSFFFSMTWWYIACNCVYRLNTKATTECVPRINLGISSTSAINPNIRINVPRNIWHSHSAWNSKNKLITKTESKKKLFHEKTSPKKKTVSLCRIPWIICYHFNECTAL